MPVKLRYHALQSKLYRTKVRFPVVWAGRGSGKTEICRRKIIRCLSMDHSHVRAVGDVPRYFYGLPTATQAKRVAWDALKNLVPREWYERSSSGRTFYESDKIIKSRFGVELHLVGLDSPQRIEGNQWCGGVLDESSDQKPGVFNRTVRPALTAFNGWCAIIGVPKRFGIGAVDFKSFCDLAQKGGDPDFEAFTWMSESVVSPDEIERIKRSLNERDFREQYQASWEQAAGSIFHAYREDLNLSPNALYNPAQRVTVGSDFNVDPMCWVIGHRTANTLHVFDELEIRNTNTQETLNLLHNKYANHRAGWDFCGDASARARKTSASSTDYIQILNDERFIDKQVYYLKSNPPLVDRFAACNAMLCNAKGEVRVFINPACKRLIADLNGRSFKPGTNEAADVGDMGHMSDAFGYIITRFWPLQVSLESNTEIIIRHG